MAGAIDQLAAGDRVVFVAHLDAGITSKRQKELWIELQGLYRNNALGLRRLLLRLRRRRLPGGSTTCSRLASAGRAPAPGRAIAVADALDPDCPVVMPENGFIGINVP